jgi:hypothetical protein
MSARKTDMLKGRVVAEMLHPISGVLMVVDVQFSCATAALACGALGHNN